MVKKLILLLFLTLNTKASDTIKVGLFNVAPFSYSDETGKLNGVTYKFLEKLSVQANIKFEYTLFPYQRLINSLKDGSVDMAMFYPSDSFHDGFEASCETLGNDNYIILSESLEAKKLDELKGKKIAIIRGAKYSEEFEMNKEIVRVYVNNYDQSISMFLSDRVDGLVIPKVALQYIISKKKELPEKKFKNGFVLNHKKNWLHIRNNFSIELKKRIIKANTEVIKNNNLKELDDLSNSVKVN